MKIENVAVISLEDYSEYQELKAKNKPLELHYILNDHAYWFSGNFDHVDKSHYDYIKSVIYNRVSYKMVLIGKNIFLAK